VLPDVHLPAVPDNDGRQYILGDDGEPVHGLRLLMAEPVIVRRGIETAGLKRAGDCRWYSATTVKTERRGAIEALSVRDLPNLRLLPANKIANEENDRLKRIWQTGDEKGSTSASAISPANSSATSRYLLDAEISAVPTGLLPVLSPTIWFAPIRSNRRIQ
jgi:hypothetical protein